MKKTIITMMALSAIALSSCGVLSGTANKQAQPTQATTVTTSNAATQGQSAGAALKSLYAQYKADGKFDTKNLNNIINTLQLVNACSDLKNNAKQSDYWKNFVSGLILGSEQLVTEKIAQPVTEQLTSLAAQVDTTKLQQATTDVTAAAGSIGQAATSLSNIFSLFK